MIKNVLIVDDDPDILMACREGLSRYARAFSVITAEEGENAAEQLRQQPVSLVVTDLQMPRMDGLGLLAHIMGEYPDIPVIVMTGHSTRQLKALVGRRGAVGYIEKPFLMEDLARKVVAALRRESEGGTLHGFATGMFIQLIVMEGRTCTIRVLNRGSGEKGVLFFLDGELMDARVNTLSGVDAAYEVLSWDDVSLSIQNTCAQKEKKVTGDVQGILLETMRRKDEMTAEEDDAPESEAS